MIRLWPYGAAVAIVLSAIWWVDHRGYERARRDAQVDQLTAEILARRRTAKLEQAMTAALAKIDGNLSDRLTQIRVIRETLQPIIQRETISDPRYRDPSCSLTPGVLDALNRARAATDPAASASELYIPLPATAEDHRRDAGRAGDGGR